MKSVGKHYNKKHLAIPILVFVVVGVFIGMVWVITNPSQIVTKSQMKIYVNSYLSEYYELYHAYIGNIINSNSKNYTFTTYRAKAVISNVHGALVQFNYTSDSSASSFKAQTTNDPIEFYEWPNMPSLQVQAKLKSIQITNGDYYLTAPVHDPSILTVVDPGATIWYSGQYSGLDLSGNGSIIVYGTVIYKDGLILKGSNSPSDWSALQGQFDALNWFIWESTGVLNNTQITGLRTQYEVPLLLELMGNRISDGSYRDNPNLFITDYNQLKGIANNNTQQQVLNDYYASQKVVPPSLLGDFWKIITDPWIIAIIGWLVSPFVSVYVTRRLDR